MANNVSNNAKTIKDMFAKLPSDNYVVDKSILYCTYNSNNYQLEFGNIIDDFRDYFEKYLVEVDLPKKFYYQPAAFSQNYYGTPDLDFLVLYFSKCMSLFEFNKEKIKVLPASRLLEINRLFVEFKNDVNESYNNPTKYIEE